MKATQVSLGPTKASLAKERATLVPEMLAAVGARYSRSNLGLEAILEKVSVQDQEQSIDAIFRFIDFGHASVADMAPVAIFMDGVSMWLAYHLWALCPTAGGQESSTRYIRLSSDNLPDPNDLGIPPQLQGEWQSAINDALGAYEKAGAFWESYAAKHPEVLRIPASLLSDESDKAQKAVTRMKRNYAFDRARYFLPAALQTNVMMVQSARAWVGLCQQLLSHQLPEAQRLGALIREELALVAPRLIKHAAPNDSWKAANQRSFARLFERANPVGEEWGWLLGEEDDEAFLNVWTNPADAAQFADDLKFHDNRYAFVGETLQATPLQFGWRAVALGDIRDLNRHRTGTKSCDLVPVGFYGAEDQSTLNLPPVAIETGQKTSSRALELLAKEGQPFAFYWFLLGTQFGFSHTTTADKFIYEAELRTGVGAHYRYAKHLRDALGLWYQRFPATRGLILEGSAEPE